MNIREAKNEIKRTLQAYHRKDAAGVFCYPIARQRPILLIGPPGIGKTAIMEQIASECNVGLVSYTMTHHTRQSAIGLPKIVQQEYDGQSYSVTEYTLSEIIKSVYDCMKVTGHREGILFLDEINCVSETLAPVMLQFLQNKQFGNQKVPAGWLIVAAGNPGIYNKSVREFDIVTLDRVRRIDVEEDLKCWLDYACSLGVHGAILSYLKLKPERFYSVRQEGERKEFVTARGWEDLSQLLIGYEQAGFPIKEDLVMQFLQDRSTSADFTAYYQVYSAYGSDFCAEKLLSGEITPEEQKRVLDLVRQGSLEIRFTFVSQLTDVLGQMFSEYDRDERFLKAVGDELNGLFKTDDEYGELQKRIQQREARFDREYRLNLTDWEQERRHRHILHFLRSMYVDGRSASSLRETARQKLADLGEKQNRLATRITDSLERGIAILDEFREDGGEMLLFVSTIARMQTAAAFLISHPNETFLKRSGRLLTPGNV